MSHPRVLLASNPAYWPSVGGSEMVLERILLGVRDMFDRVVVFAPRDRPVEERDGIEIRPYERSALRRFARKVRPAVYFPNMAHSDITLDNLRWVARFSGKTVVNMVGGYAAGTPLIRRRAVLEAVARHADVAVHVDALSTEYIVDRAIAPVLPFEIIPQGLSFAELLPHRLDGEAGDPYVVYGHNLWHWKGTTAFLEDVVAALPHVRFVIAASDRTGDVIAEVADRATAYANLELRLGRPRDEFLATLAGAEAVVSTSEIEGAQPNVMLECGYLGVPYLSVFAGQNFGHYPHVEMFETVARLARRLRQGHPRLRAEKRNELVRAQALLSEPRFSWESVVGRYRSLFSGPG
jgi:glycosyltransferase involved in cell wall biosynthesis